MSGGSFEYLYADDVDDLLRKFRDRDGGDLEAMARALIEYSADDVAAEIEELRLDIRAFRVRVAAKMKRLSPVMQAVEWHHSMDSGPEQVQDAVRRYRS